MRLRAHALFHGSDRVTRALLDRVLILPPGHAQAVHARRRLSVREKWMIRGVAAAVVAIAIAVVISLATAGPRSSHGCIYATFPGVVGADQISECGAAARDICASVLAPGAYSSEGARTVIAECRKAGLPVGR
jgi:hypothetical protein